MKDGAVSLEVVIQHLVQPASLPVLTIGDLDRVLKDMVYCERCAQRLADVVFELEKFLGITRLYLT